MQKTQLIIVAGFLGAGKSTLMLRAAQRLQAQGLRVGLITNDQGHDLVDTALAQTGQAPVIEVQGGCFCCRFPDLLTAVMTLRDQVAPDVILAEPVGSCTDIAATVLRPLRAFHGEMVQIAPLTVLSDPHRSLTSFIPQVAYLHHKQLAEAEIIVLSKVDTLTPPQLQHQLAQLHQHHPQQQIVTIAQGDDASVDAWLTLVRQQRAVPRTLDIDYGTYADAEAALGWLNAVITLQAPHPFGLDSWLAGALQRMAQLAWQDDAAIAHLKMYAQTPHTQAKASMTTTTGTVTWDLIPQPAQTTQATVTVNARIGTTPALLTAMLHQLLAQQPRGITATLVRHECFAPAPPQPTYRLQEDVP
ncbi:MAG: GTP-binding protein [Roseiflexaceae bacterium]|jgi:G3E family GTPase|nr:CobW-like GTP-binding protein [Chloroflexaceae bacterium]